MRQIRKQSIKSVLFPQKKILLFALMLVIGLYGHDGMATAAYADMTEAEKVTFMENHYTEAMFSHDALIQGDLEMLRTRLAKLAEQELPASAPKSWKPHHDRLIKAASRATRVATLKDAASVMADVGEACGACHKALGVRQMYYWPAEPTGGDKLAKAMRTHQWATERLWEGVTGPFEEAWGRGAEALSDVRVFEKEKEKVKSSLLKLEAELRDLGLQAKATTGLHYRAELYGRLLVTCAKCHREAGITIKPAKPIPPWQK